MKHIKTALVHVLILVSGFIYSFCLPIILKFAFNCRKGIYNDPEGKMFVGPAWLVLIIATLLFCYMIYKSVKITDLRTPIILITVICILISLAMGTFFVRAEWIRFLDTMRFNISHIN